MIDFEDLFKERARLGPAGRILLGLFLWGQMALQVYLLLLCWPRATGFDKENPPALWCCTVTQEVALICSIALLGAMGGSTHALSSFSRFSGNRNLVRSWLWWYLLRSPIGVSLAIVIYFVVRGGLLGGSINSSTSGGVEGINPYGLGALAALAGLCSEAATRKLSDVFETLFRSDKNPDKDPLAANAPPQITSMSPDQVKAGSPDTQVTLTGSALSSDDIVLIGDLHLPLTFVSASQAKVNIPAARLTAAGELELIVCRGPNLENRSDPLKLRIV